MSFTFRPATRTNSKLLIGLYGQSGSGKTMSSLLLARGLAGDKGRVLMIDTESGRGELYADVIPGGYDVVQLEQPFSPARYTEAIIAAEQAGAAVLVIDSGSHEWEGIGGVTDMAGEIERRTGKPGLHCWKEPKMQHQKFILKLLQTPLHVVVCLRAKYKSRQAKNPRTGRTEIVKDEHTSPIQAEDFIYEATAHAEVLADHTIRLTKCSHPAMEACWPKGKPISVETGRLLAKWCDGAKAAPHANAAVNPSATLTAAVTKDGPSDDAIHAGDPFTDSYPGFNAPDPDTGEIFDDAPDPRAIWLAKALAEVATLGAPAVGNWVAANKAHIDALDDAQKAELKAALVERKRAPIEPAAAAGAA